MIEKIDEYFRLLYPQYENLSEEEQKRVLNDKKFIRENLDKIELMYQNACSNGKSPEEAIRDAVRLSRKISTQQIGQATINTPTATKKEAEQVENNENTRDDIKEGEKVGDDN